MHIKSIHLEYIAKRIYNLYSDSLRLDLLAGRVREIADSKKILIPSELVWESIYDILNDYSNHHNKRLAIDKITKIFELLLEPLVYPNEFIYKLLPTAIIDDINKYLGEDKLEIQIRGRNLVLIELNKARMRDTRTLTDYISEAREYFKSEYSKVKIVGLHYEYDFNVNIGELFRHQNTNTTQVYKDLDIHENLGLVNGETKAFIYLFRHGYIKDFEVRQRPDRLGVEYDYAVCRIDESKLLQSEDPISNIIDTNNSKRSSRIGSNIQENDSVDIIKTNKQKNRFPFTIHGGTTWENIYIKFNNDEEVTIMVNCYKHNTSFADMGFIDNRSGKPNSEWALLIIFAKNGGRLSSGNPEARDRYKKIKQLLSDSLKYYFSIEYDPFKKYNKSDGYELKLNLSYPKQIQEKISNSLSDEINDMFKGYS